MSDQTGGAGAEHSCKNCGAVFRSPQALGGHSAHCSEAADSAESAKESDDLHWVEDYVLNTPKEALESAIEDSGFNAKEEDSVLTSAAKAIIKDNSGGAADYVDTFGQCSAEGCDWGANGFEADYCINHQTESDEEDSSGDEGSAEGTEDSPEGTDESRADYVAQLVERGLSVKNAEVAAEVRFS